MIDKELDIVYQVKQLRKFELLHKQLTAKKSKKDKAAEYLKVLQCDNNTLSDEE